MRSTRSKSRVFGDFAVVTGRNSSGIFAVVTGRNLSGIVSTPRRTSHIYARRQGRWLCVAAHWLSGETPWRSPGAPPTTAVAPEQTHDSNKDSLVALRRRFEALRAAGDSPDAV